MQPTRSDSLGIGGAPFRLVVFVASAAGFAFALAYLCWLYLPYEALERRTLTDQFFVWEGITWLVGLILILLGVSNILDTVGWKVGDALRAAWRPLSRRPGTSRRIDVAIVPFWMITTGGIFLLIGVLARAYFFPSIVGL